MQELNEFTGMSDKRLMIRLADLEHRLVCIREDGDAGAGSPGEGIAEEIDAIDRELTKRKLARNK